MSIQSVIRVAYTRWHLPADADQRRKRRCTLCQDRVTSGLMVERVAVSYDWRILVCESCLKQLGVESAKLSRR
jgi:hypothetical protein